MLKILVTVRHSNRTLETFPSSVSLNLNTTKEVIEAARKLYSEAFRTPFVFVTVQ